MRTLKHESANGIIEYRLPTIPETTKLMGELKNFTKDEVAGMLWFIDHIEPWIVNVQLICDKDIIDSYEKMMDYPEVIEDLMAVSGLIIQKSLGSLASKKKE